MLLFNRKLGSTVKIERERKNNNVLKILQQIQSLKTKKYLHCSVIFFFVFFIFIVLIVIASYEKHILKFYDKT